MEMDSAHVVFDGEIERTGYLPGGLGYALAALVAVTFWAGTAAAQHGEEAHNMRLVGHHDLQARSTYWGVIEEQNGRWIAYAGHHNGTAFNPLTGLVETNGTSIVDVTNPRRPFLLHHLPVEGDPNVPDDGGSQMSQVCSGDELPGGESGKYYLLRTNGDFGHQIYDVTDPANPVFIVDVTTGLDGTHKNWWECDTGIAYLVADLQPEGWTTDRGLKVFDLSNPASPVFIRNFGMVGSQPGATEPPVRDPGIHEPTVLGNHVYLAYGTSGDGAMQIVDREALLGGDPDPTEENLLAPVIAQLNMPDYWGGHTAWGMHDVVLPEFELFEDPESDTQGSPRDFVLLTSEATSNSCFEPMQHMTFFVDITDPDFPFPVSNYHVEEDEGNYCDRGGRFGAHSQNWSYNENFYRKVVIYSWFNAGARAVDVRNPYHPKEVGFYVPATTENTDERCAEIGGIEECFIAIQTNNVELDDRNLIYLFDRANTGMHIVELTGEARQIIQDGPTEEQPAEGPEVMAGAP
jgi:hypothetical protein